MRRLKYEHNREEQHRDILIPLPLGFGVYASHIKGDHFSIFLRSWERARSDWYDYALRSDTRAGRHAMHALPRRRNSLADRWDNTGKGFFMKTLWKETA